MTQEEKELVLKDLCARLPYGVKVTWDGLYSITLIPSIYGEICKEDRDENIPKVYLRPMSSMTREEKKDYDNLLMSIGDGCENTDYMPDNCMRYIDWLNQHHFDYRGLIEKGLALPAPEGMYE